MGFPGGPDGKESSCNARNMGLIPGLGRSPGGGHDNPLQYSCLENPYGQRSLVGTVQGIARSQMWLSNVAQHSTVHIYQSKSLNLSFLVFPSTYTANEKFVLYICHLIFLLCGTYVCFCIFYLMSVYLHTNSNKDFLPSQQTTILYCIEWLQS